MELFVVYCTLHQATETYTPIKYVIYSVCFYSAASTKELSTSYTHACTDHRIPRSPGRQSVSQLVPAWLVAVEAGVVAAEVLDPVVAVPEDAEAEEDADEEADDQDRQHVAPHMLLGELELAHGASLLVGI